MSFNRPPRIQTPLPIDKIEIPIPPNLPSKPGASNWLTIVLSFGAIVLTVIFVMLVSGGNSASLGYLIFLPIMLVSYLATWLSSRSAKKKYDQDLAQAKDEYGKALRSTEKSLQDVQKKLRQIMLEVNPDLGECIRRVGNQDLRIGERRPEDPDFLAPRLGVGTVKTSITIVEVDQKGRAPELQVEYKFADQLARNYSNVRDVPVVANFPKTGSVGIAGSEKEVRDLVRALISHIMVHHWPTEVEIAGIGGDIHIIEEWGWMRYLPHATTLLEWKNAYSSDDKEALSNFMDSLEAVLQNREEIIETMRNTSEKAPETSFNLPRILIIFDQLPAAYNHPGLSLFFQKGRELGVYGLFLAKNIRHIPGGCGAIVHFQDNQAIYQEVGYEGISFTCDRPDWMNRKQAEDLARKLGEISLIQVSDLSRPPSRLSFMELFGFNKIEDIPVESWWESESPYGYLRVPIGKTSDKAPLIFNLSDKDGAHGPHGVIGGITGSGKSEVLKTIILGLALTHHPYDINFALIDYKGGAAFNELANLPHTVGVVTDIETHSSYAERVILALSGEIEHRKKILDDARQHFQLGRTHIDEYRKLAVKKLLPRLVIVFDEFAEFKQRHAEESKRLISIARLGRSLGIHLILATQNIQAAIDPEILQNATFRICLRVSEPQDSMQMIGIRDAVSLSRGRAYFSSQTRHLFQGAFSGGLYKYAGRETPTISRQSADDQDSFFSEKTEAQVLTERLINAAENLNLRKPPAIWPDPLSERLFLPKLLKENVEGGWDGKNWTSSGRRNINSSSDLIVYPIIGLCDQPALQRQSLLQVDPSRGEGNMLIFGSAKTGKSTLLRTFVSSLVHTKSPAEAWVYILDFGGQSALKVLESFPHVGSVITRFETEKAQRSIEFIHARIAERNEIFRQSSVDSWEDYNRASKNKNKKLPAIYLIIDGFGSLRRTFMNMPNSPELINSIVSLVNGGLAFGIHLVIASNLPSDLPQELFGNINLRMTFHQADHRSYFEIVGQPSEARIREDVSRPAVAGRGLLRSSPPLEFQAALPVLGESDNDQYLGLKTLGEKMAKGWKTRQGDLPPEIRSLPFLITLPKVDPRSFTKSDYKRPFYLPLGQDYEDLEEIGFSLDRDGPTFLIAGASPHSGKTTFLYTWLIGLADRYSKKDIQLYLLDFHSRSLSGLRDLPIIDKYVGIKSELASALDQIDKEIKKRAEQLEKTYEKSPISFNMGKFLESLSQIVVVIDDYESFSPKISDNERNQLVNCLASGEELGFTIIIAGDLSKLPLEYGAMGPSLMQRIKQQGCGILLGGSEGADQFNNARIPSFQRAVNLPPGRGYIMQRGQGKMFQAYAYWSENEEPTFALSNWRKK
jgi:DNA segregation ATPase FtsK/SpoIIIE, S-DNA-T family